MCSSGHIKINGFCFPKVSGCTDYDSAGTCISCDDYYFLNSSNECKCVDEAHLIGGKCVMCGSHSVFDAANSKCKCADGFYQWASDSIGSNCLKRGCTNKYATNFDKNARYDSGQCDLVAPPANCPSPNQATTVKNIQTADLANDRDLFFLCAPYKKLEIEIVSENGIDFRFLKGDCPTTNTN